MSQASLTFAIEMVKCSEEVKVAQRKQVPAFLTIKLGRKRLTMTNALAYFARASAKTKRLFAAFVPGVVAPNSQGSPE